MNNAYLISNTNGYGDYWVIGIFKDFENVKKFFIHQANGDKKRIKEIKNALTEKELSKVVHCTIDKIYCDF